MLACPCRYSFAPSGEGALVRAANFVSDLKSDTSKWIKALMKAPTGSAGTKRKFGESASASLRASLIHKPEGRQNSGRWWSGGAAKPLREIKIFSSPVKRGDRTSRRAAFTHAGHLDWQPFSVSAKASVATGSLGSFPFYIHAGAALAMLACPCLYSFAPSGEGALIFRSPPPHPINTPNPPSA